MTSSRSKLVFFSVVVCPEMVILLLIPLCTTVLDQVLSPIVTGLSLPPDKLKFLSLLPGGAFFLTLKDFKAVLQPDHSNKDVLLLWPEYWALKLTYFGGLAYQGLFSLIALSVWLSGAQTLTVWVSVALLLPIIGAVFSYATILLARVKVQEKLAKIQNANHALHTDGDSAMLHPRR